MESTTAFIQVKKQTLPIDAGKGDYQPTSDKTFGQPNLLN